MEEQQTKPRIVGGSKPAFDFKTFNRTAGHPTLMIGLTGRYGTGKTFTALKIGFDVAKHFGGRVGVVDLERRRAEVYQGQLGYFDHLPLNGNDVQEYEPDPAIIEAAVKHLVDQGCSVVIVDGFSDEWEFTVKRAGQNFKNWDAAKEPHKRLLQALQSCPARLVLLTFKAQEKFTMRSKGINAKGVALGDEVVSLGEQHRQDKDLPYLLDIFIRMDDMEGQAVARIGLKCRIPALKHTETPNPGRELSGPIIEYLSGDNLLKVIESSSADDVKQRIEVLPKAGRQVMRRYLNGIGCAVIADVPATLVVEMLELLTEQEKDAGIVQQSE